MPYKEASIEEQELGLELFFTDTPGVEGRLKKTPDDFKVIERSIDIESISDSDLSTRDPGSPVYTYARVRSRNWETNRLLHELARQLRIDYDKIFFAGTKDKRAITTQLMAFSAPPERISEVSLNDVEIFDIFVSSHLLKIGDLLGNNFEINISELEQSKTKLNENIEKTTQQLAIINGFPNFFGVQRFGVMRPITHDIGKLLLQGKFEEAIFLYIGNPIEGESQIDFEVRTEFDRCWDFEWAFENYPKHLNFERMLIRYLINRPEDYIGALKQFPKNLGMMFLHAYQSLLFNKILCARIREGIPLSQPILGDIILPIDEYYRPVHKTWIIVNERNQEKITKQCSVGKAFISGVLFGSQTQFAEGEFGELERKVIEGEEIEAKDFIIPELIEISSKGNRRELVAPVNQFKYTVSEDQIKINFGLIKGAYATILLREYMKSKIKNY
jgi:tRNA pseudouridine13 synthase